MKYVAIGPMKGKSFKLPAGLAVVDGTVEVPDALHKSYGHVLRADWGVLPEHEVPPEEPKQEVPAEEPKQEVPAEEPKQEVPAEEPKQEQTVIDEPEVAPDVNHAKAKPRRK